MDNNQRASFFGAAGDTRWNQRRLAEAFPSFAHIEMDIRDRAAVLNLIEELKPALIVHTAAQPSHDLAISRPFDDIEANAVGILNMLIATRRPSGDAIFVHMGTYKLCGHRLVCRIAKILDDTFREIH